MKALDKTKVFLVIDDDGMVREILADYLRSFGYERILIARDGKDGLKIIHDHNQHLDVVISDWEMPHVDGLTLLRALRRDPTRDGCKFIMVTSQSSHERMKISKAAKSQVDAYIVKPFRAQVLRDKVLSLLRGPGDFEPSLSEFNELAHMTLAETKVLLEDLMAKSQWKKAADMAQEAVIVYDGNPDIQYLWAKALSGQGLLEEAIEQIQRLIKRNPYHIEAQSLLMDLQEKKKAS